MATKSKQKKIRREFQRGLATATQKVKLERQPFNPHPGWVVGYREGLGRLSARAVGERK